MRTRSPLMPTLRQAATWSRPYPSSPFSAVLYADGGDSGNAVEVGAPAEDTKPDTGDGGEGGKAGGEDATDWKAEAEKYRALQKKWEARAKENSGAAKERDDLRRQHMSEQEKAVDEAAAKARVEERTRLAGKLARQGFLAAAAGRVPNAGDVADDLNLAKYVAEDGEVDEKGLAELVERLAPKPTAKESDTDTKDGGDKAATARANGRGFDQGPRGGGSTAESSVSAGRELYAQRKSKTSIT